MGVSLFRLLVCGAASGAAGACAGVVLGPRRELRLGEEVEERDAWGLDCFTRTALVRRP